MDTKRTTVQINLEPEDNKRLANLCGQFDAHLRQIERYLGVEINNRGNEFQIIGPTESVNLAAELLPSLYHETDQKEDLTPAKIHLFLQQFDSKARIKEFPEEAKKYILRTPKEKISPRGENQLTYVKNMLQYDISFGIGPAGTGKTYLAVAAAIQALEKEEVSRVILVRPAVEAGERLGFLPGGMAEKVDPYLRPMYDALYEMMGFEHVGKLVEQHIIEIAPLAYMRGRNLNDSFIILDEAQNTTKEQMKMFLTRIGFGSKAVVTGDITQIDLPKGVESGLRHIITVLKDIDEISFTFFQSKDVVRHPIVQSIIEAYDKQPQ